MSAAVAHDESRLAAANQRLAELLRVDPLPLATGGAGAMADALWVWGVLGGKNVGKSTLINALAGAEVVDRGDDAGEGTIAPAAYLSADDLPALTARFANLEALDVRYKAGAPASMQRLALVDLPDFDSLFTDHVETVRRISPALDGVIWVTTPKKLGDLRAIHEIHRVLKARVNFIYVVNKMDWLIAQSDAPPSEAIDRAQAALDAQVREADGAAASPHTFLISAKSPTAQGILSSVAASRGSQSAGALDDATRKAAEVLAGNFAALREMLTTAPSVEATAANKRANLDFQIRRQARQVIEHYQPAAILDRLDRALDPAALDELCERYFPTGYVDAIFRRHNSDRELFSEWSGTLFRKRIAHWPTLGIVAWPVTLLSGLVDRLRGAMDGSPGRDGSDLFRCDGVGLDERVDGAVEGVRARLSGEASRLGIELPEGELLERRYRQDVAGVVEQHRGVVFDSLTAARPGAIGRAVRVVIPIATLLWFPLIQPVLAAGLAIAGGGWKFEASTLLTMVQALSAAKVLAGLAVSLLILAALAATVYSRVVRDTYGAIDKLRSAPIEAGAEPFGKAVIATIVHPVEQTRQQLTSVVETLRELASPLTEPRP